MPGLKKGITAFKSEDYTKAFELLKPIADRGNAEAQCIIANMYHLGLGLDCDISEAVKWYKKSANQGYGLAANNLGCIFMMGAPDIDASQAEAEKWYQKARRQGFLHT
ncbi:sel1 repeat family protein [Gloeocapsopsis crepidinum LEGE 06123]|uniref:Sel1 repeat family protein n=1 Tax=Gloeocapsopsis crepidinum LEGE 06123 TaxID=588587 RepID=A0ABR9UNX4_9CHRO|nr:tetratricopeptide repeat protein [Gloeocapsopsis crepidinum]MBE9189992.1 sel1 repeat family protein [Gloeocapsopsis crepidinum LEGE 06123]